MNGMTANETHCWRSIGIWAKDGASCPKLKDCVTCANCDVFVSNGRGLFELEPSAGYLVDWARLLGQSRREGVDAGESILIFRLEEEWLAFPTAAFKFVAEMPKIHSVPRKSGALLLGLVNAGDSLQLCFSLKALLGIERGGSGQAEGGGPSKAPRCLALERDGQTWLFLADEILGVFRYDPARVGNIPSTVSKANPTFIRKVFLFEGRNVGLLDDELAVFALKRSLQ